jgi:GTP cyclohydrolase II
LVAVDRASAELRRGGVVVIASPHGALLVGAAEATDGVLIDRLQQLAGSEARLIITARRASVMGLDPQGAGALTITLPQPVEETLVAVLSDPAAAINSQTPPPMLPSACQSAPVASGDPAEAAVLLTKLARLLPAAVVAPLAATDANAWADHHGVALVLDGDIRNYHQTAAHTLRPVGEARVPLEGAENARIMAFRPADGGIEHLAILIGTPTTGEPVLARLHSECFTGDLLGSLRCDCGDQLRGAILAIADAGAGVLLYLAQEGRGIGLVNKLRAYQLQDAGFDTLDANGQLGFDDDERIYQPAAEMLRQLGFDSVRLMTNNPLKVEALARHGVTVSERVPHVFQSNVHNLSYLRTKAIKGGHLF